MDHHETMVKVLDWSAAAVVVSTILGWLPAVAAGFSIIWYCVLLWEKYSKWRKAQRQPED